MLYIEYCCRSRYPFPDLLLPGTKYVFLRLKKGMKTRPNRTSLNARDQVSAGTIKPCATTPGNNSGTIQAQNNFNKNDINISINAVLIINPQNIAVILFFDIMTVTSLPSLPVSGIDETLVFVSGVNSPPYRHFIVRCPDNDKGKFTRVVPLVN